MINESSFPTNDDGTSNAKVPVVIPSSSDNLSEVVPLISSLDDISSGEASSAQSSVSSVGPSHGTESVSKPAKRQRLKAVKLEME